MMTSVARYVALHRISSIPDSELIVSRKQKDIPDYHWCKGCQWATNLGDRYMCPFVEGSCVRIPWSIDNPNPELLHKRIRYEHEHEKNKQEDTNNA